MNIAGIDYSTHAVDIVTIPMDGPGHPQWHTFPLQGDNAFDGARDVANELHGRNSLFWDEILAVGIEQPGGYQRDVMARVQGAILSCIPARMLVEPWPPAKWRKAVGLKGNATKEAIFEHSAAIVTWPVCDDWPQDAHDAHLIAIATRHAIEMSTP